MSKKQEEHAGTTTEDAFEILDNAPQAIRRPLCLVAGHAYATNYVWVGKPGCKSQPARVILRDDGQAFSDSAIPDGSLIGNLGLSVELRHIPPEDRTWSGQGVKRYRDGERPDPADVFERTIEVVDRFMDFTKSLADQHRMCELTACYILATYLLDAFNVIGYLWPNGEKGSGKTHFLFTVTELAYLGQVILAGGTYASLRDLADYAACLAFDDCDNSLNPRGNDSDKRTLLLAGNRRGATVTLKEPKGERDWSLRAVSTFCPRLFSAIRFPDAVLASRTIVIPLVRSVDSDKTIADPQDHECWPHDRRRLVDDLWALGLENLPRLKDYDVQAARRSHLKGRDLEPWRAVLAVALWLQEEHEVCGLFDRMEALSRAYQCERWELEANDSTRILIRALWQMLEKKQVEVLEFETSTLAMHMELLAEANDLVGPSNDTFTNPRRVGWTLRRLRFQKATPGKTKRRWRTTKAEVIGLVRAYGIGLPPEQNAENAKNAEMQVPAVGVSAISAFSALSAEGSDAEAGAVEPPESQISQDKNAAGRGM